MGRSASRERGRKAAGSCGPVWQPGFQASCRVLSVSGRAHCLTNLSGKVEQLKIEFIGSKLTMVTTRAVNPEDPHGKQSDDHAHSTMAVPILPLRVIYPTFAPGVQPECILDSGSQIVVMRRDIWERLRTPLDARKLMPMQSANSGKTMTIGVMEDFPVQFGPVTVRLHIQVIEDAPFEVLLGRPFFDITSCSEVSQQGGKHSIIIHDPQTQNPYLFPTQPRSRTTSRSSSGVNFRE